MCQKSIKKGYKMVNEANKAVHTDAVDEHEEMDFAAMLEESFKDSERDALINGVVVAIKEDVILVDVGKKSEGRLNASEVTDENGNITCKVGDVIPVVITGFRNERPAVSHKKALRKDRIKSFIADFKEEDDVVLDVKITGKNKGGFIAENKEGIEFFLPRSQAAVKDMNALMGKSLKVKIIKIDNETESIIVSRKKFLDDERKKRKEIVQELIDRDEGWSGARTGRVGVCDGLQGIRERQHAHVQGAWPEGAGTRRVLGRAPLPGLSGCFRAGFPQLFHGDGAVCHYRGIMVRHDRIADGAHHALHHHGA
jgi:small subunit ribosomal protein S1